MTDNENPDRSQTEGQEGIDRETELRNRENETGQPQGRQELGKQADRQPSEQDPGSGFVGTGTDPSSDDLTKSEQNPDFAPEGQGAQDTDAGRSDIETGQSQDRASGFDDGSDSDH